MDHKEDLDIIIFALTRYDGPYSSISISMAKEFSKSHRVFYINHPYSLKDVFTVFRSRSIIRRLPALFFGKNNMKSFYDQGAFGVTMVTPRVTIPINFLPKGRLYDRLQRLNDRILFSSVRKLIKQERISKFLFINTFDPFFAQRFPKDIQPEIKIYQCVDDLEESPYTRKHGRYLEKAVMQTYDMTLTTSRELTKIKSKYSTSIYYLPNAVDPGLFNQAYFEKLKVPSEFTGVSKKIIGYIGNIEQRMDYDLVKKIATAHSDKLVYLIGPTSSNEYRKEGLDKVGNILFTGGKNIEELPAYLQNIDCAIIPFRCNKLTRSIYPLKVNEYLAGGKPVVTTNFSEDIRLFKDVVHIAANHEEFIELISVAINDTSGQSALKRIEYAGQNSWEARVEQFWKIIDEFTTKR